MSDKIAIRYNKKNVCRLPIIPYMKVNKEDIIVGINYIDAEYWQEAKKHDTVKYKLENGIIEEIKVEKKDKVIEIVKTDKIIKQIKDKEDEIKSLKDKIFEIAVQIGETEDKKIIKEKEKEIKECEKQIENLEKDIENLTYKKEKIDMTNFSKLTEKEKESIIEETYKIKTLEEFKDLSVDNPAIRYKIEKRIDKIKNAKTDETIGHPDSHLKTS